MQVAERKIFQFPLDVTDSQSMRQRRIDIKHLAGHTHALLFRRVFHRTNGAGPLCKLDQRHPDVVDHGDQHLANVIELALGLAQHITLKRVMDGRYCRHLLNTINQPGHLIAELLADVLQGNPFLPHCPVENCCHQAGLVEVQFHQYLSHFDAGSEAAGTRGPDPVLAYRLYINRGGHFTGPPELFSILKMRL